MYLAYCIMCIFAFFLPHFTVNLTETVTGYWAISACMTKNHKHFFFPLCCVLSSQSIMGPVRSNEFWDTKLNWDRCLPILCNWPFYFHRIRFWMTCWFTPKKCVFVCFCENVFRRISIRVCVCKDGLSTTLVCVCVYEAGSATLPWNFNGPY